MNAQRIDKLEGHELNVAVTTELGYMQCSKHSAWWRNSGVIIRIPDHFDPAHNVNDAMTLDDAAGQEWTIFERGGKVIIATNLGLDFYTSTAQLVDFPTKSAAYAAARCRAWLKARQTKKEYTCEHGFTISCPEGCN